MGIGKGRKEGIQKRKPYPPVGLIYIGKSIKNRILADKTAHGRHNMRLQFLMCVHRRHAGSEKLFTFFSKSFIKLAIFR